MNAGYLQDLRYKLQKRYRRLNSIDDFELFHSTLSQFLNFLKSNVIYSSMIELLEAHQEKFVPQVKRLLSRGDMTDYPTEFEQVAYSYFILKECAGHRDAAIAPKIMLMTQRGSQSNSINDKLPSFRTHFLEPVYEFIDEGIDSTKFLLGLLKRYKHKCEWFQREYLYKLWEKDSQIGEKQLAWHLYEYLYDQGIDLELTIEPTSISGEVDLIAAQKGEDLLIADAKIFNPQKGKGKPYIAKGFNQIYQYTLDYNQPLGYLIIYKTCQEDLAFTLKGHNLSVPFTIHNNKTIFIIVIDLYQHELSASVRGKLKTIEINDTDLISPANQSTESDAIVEETQE